MSAILLIGLLPTNPVLAEQKTTSKASYGYAITVNEKNEFYIELGHSTINKAIDLSKKRCLSTNKGNCFLLSSGNKRFVAFSMQIINDKFVTFLAQKKAGLGATSSNESIKDAIRGSKYACISNAPAKNQIVILIFFLINSSNNNGAL
ncbi:hypothetical protein HC864_00445 [Candidatus Gracilibacteria bacterium]|nr:hypothetical protein [Candidatus Gracilibacteria bacterium]